ncbi:MAG: hypothetical protein JXQ29_05040 [Planctomycetes bacterium]|nr:hypothetical protein [Planctomycetota bacterium]
MDIDSPAKPYWMAASLATAPGIALPDSRAIPLHPDALFFLSLSGLTNLFVDFKGSLDATGFATAKVNILDAPVVLGLTIHTALVVLDPATPTGIGTLSNPWPIPVTARP